MRKLILRNQQSSSDIVMLAAAVRDLKRALGAAVAVDVRTPCFAGCSSRSEVPLRNAMSAKLSFLLALLCAATTIPMKQSFKGEDVPK